jgi:hypothetical protein
MPTYRDIRRLQNIKESTLPSGDTKSTYSHAPSSISMKEGEQVFVQEPNKPLALFKKVKSRLYKVYLSHDGNQIVDRNLTVHGNIVVDGAIKGGTRAYFDGGEASGFTTDRYLDFNNGTQMDDYQGYRQHRPGSITGVSAQFNVSSQTDGGGGTTQSDVEIGVYKNGTKVFAEDIAPTSTGDTGVSATQAMGVDTFAVGNVLTLKVVFTENSGSEVEVDDFNAFMEVTYDT